MAFPETVHNKKPDAVANIERRVFHLITGSLFPIMALILPVWLVAGVAAIGVVIALALEVVRRRSSPINRWFLSQVSVLLKKGEESSRLLGSTFLLIGTLAAFLLFDRYVAVAALLFLSVGDPAAALVGERYGRTRLGKKSLEGSLAFIVASVIVGGLVLAAGADFAFSVILVGAIAGAIVELIALPPDDNMTIPLAAGGVMTALA